MMIKHLLAAAYSPRRLACIMPAFILVAFAAGNSQARKGEAEHLVPVNPYMEVADGAQYKRLYESKLFVTTGDVARFLYLPDSISTERTAAVYRASGKSNSLPGGYWVTAMEASAMLLPCIPLEGQRQKPVDPASITVKRNDAPIPASTAEAIHQLWLAMLRRSHARPGKVIRLDSTVLIFSAMDPKGVHLRAEADEVSGETRELWQIGESLILYSRLPKFERDQFARKLEEKCFRLLKRVTRSE